MGKRLEKKLDVVVSRAKAIWPDAADLSLAPLAWIGQACGSTHRPVATMNAFALDHRVNAICFCRSSILFFRPRPSVPPYSHNLASAPRQRAPDRLPATFHSGGS